MSKINEAHINLTGMRLLLAAAILMIGILPLLAIALAPNAGRVVPMQNEQAAVAALRQKLMGNDPAARQSAAEALAAIGSPAALQALIAPLADAELTPARHAAMYGLELAGQPAVAPLTAALHSSDPVLRRNAAEMLGWLRASESVPALSRALRDGDAGVQTQAAWALSEIATPAAQRALRQAAAQANEPTVRQAFEIALSRALQAGHAVEAAPTTVWMALVQAPALRWALLALSAVLAAAVLWGGWRGGAPARGRPAGAMR